MNEAALRKIQSIFERACFGYHLYLRDLRTGESIELGERRRYPIGSCFKLAVLDALFQSFIEDPSMLTESVELQLDRDFCGVSVLAHLTGPLNMTWTQLAELMISASDGLATDVIIERVGLARVNSQLKEISPEQELPNNINDMVTALRKLPNINNVKQSGSKANAIDTLDAVAELGHSNGHALAELVRHVSARTFENPELMTAWRQILQIPRVVPRSEMYFGDSVALISKSGSLSMRYFMNDCGVFEIPKTKQQIASFGYCSHGWRLPAFACESIAGLIGLELARCFELDPRPNSDWSPQAESLLRALPEAT